MSQILEHASWIYPSEDIGEICPVFRKHFTARPGAAAKLEITAFGVYEAFLNGQRIGNFFLAPGWTSYPTRLQVQTYDLTALLREENELTVTLGKGLVRRTDFCRCLSGDCGRPGVCWQHCI